MIGVRVVDLKPQKCPEHGRVLYTRWLKWTPNWGGHAARELVCPDERCDTVFTPEDVDWETWRDARPISERAFP